MRPVSFAYGPRRAAAGAAVVLNPAPAQSLPDALYAAVDILTPNETEAAQLTGAQSSEAAALALLKRGVKTAIVTLGKAGVLAATAPDQMRRVPGFKVDAVDTTVAGDAFNGGWPRRSRGVGRSRPPFGLRRL